VRYPIAANVGNDFRTSGKSAETAGPTSEQPGPICSIPAFRFFQPGTSQNTRQIVSGLAFTSMLLSCRRIFCSPMFMRKGYLNRSTGVKGKHRPDLSLSSSPAARPISLGFPGGYDSSAAVFPAENQKAINHGHSCLSPALFRFRSTGFVFARRNTARETGQMKDWWLNETAYAGREHLDASYVAGNERKAEFDPSGDLDV
jgi:hypothetical protein